MSMGHSNVIHFRRPPGAKPTADVEEFIRQARAAGTVQVIECAKPYQGDEDWVKVRNSKRGGVASGVAHSPGDDPLNPVWRAGQYWVDLF